MLSIMPKDGNIQPNEQVFVSPQAFQSHLETNMLLAMNFTAKKSLTHTSKSDGSWHGDIGDEDPEAQFEQATLKNDDI